VDAGLSPQELPLEPLAYTLLGYFVLQILLNFLVAALRRRSQHPQLLLLLGAFWSGFGGALYFVVAAVLLHIFDLAPNTETPPAGMLWWGLAGLPLGILLWYLQAMGRRLGLMIFGLSQLVAAEDAILRIPPHPRYVSWGLINVAAIQPLGRELFMRGVFLPVVALNLGWTWAVGTTVVIELLLRLNVVWVFATLLYVLMMCTLFYLSGNALCGLIAAAVAGLIHGLALMQLGFRRVEREPGSGMEPEQRSPDSEQ
jgi:hypothetical protein